MEASAPATVSVVVPARNAAGTLPAVLEALSGQTAPANSFEVIVVDDGSTDGTAEAVRKDGRARLVEAGGHVGVAASRNIGAGAATGDALAFLDADCVPWPTWIEHGLRALAQPKHDVVAGHIEVAVARPTPAALIDLTHYFDQQRYAAEGFGATGNLWVRRAAFDLVGGFDERLVRDEDRDFGRRAVAAGASVRYASDVGVVHPARGMRELIRRSFRIGRERGVAGLRARRHAGAYVAPDRMRARLASAGYSPSAVRMLWLRLAKKLCVSLPMALGAVAGGVRGRTRATQGAVESAPASDGEEDRPPSRRRASAPPERRP